MNCKKQLCLALVLYHLFELAADGNEQYVGFYSGAGRLGDDFRAGAKGLDFLVKLNYSVHVMVKALLWNERWAYVSLNISNSDSFWRIDFLISSIF